MSRLDARWFQILFLSSFLCLGAPAAGAVRLWLTYLLFKPHGLIVVLFLASWTVPLCNAVWPKERFTWALIWRHVF